MSGRAFVRGFEYLVRVGYGVLALLVNVSSVRAEPATVLALGDSLTAGYGLPAQASFPARLEQRLKAAGLEVRVVNAGVSGDTSAGGLARLDWALADRPSVAIVELGANDGLRGLDPGQTARNLDAIVAALQGRGVRVLLAGMLAPPNLGRESGDAFRQAYREVAARRQVPLYPFFLDGVAGDPRLNQKDGLHPTAEGITVIVERIAPWVIPLLRQEGGK
jgi:acyl-CoA thioesterase-1